MKGNVVEIEGKTFTIEDDISLEYYSPFLDGEEIVIDGESINPRGNVTQPFTVAGDNDLARISHNAHLLQAKGPTVTFDECKLRSDGILIEKGNVLLQRIPRNLNNGYWKAECLFFSEAATFTDLVGDKNVRALTMHEEIVVAGVGIGDLLGQLQTQFGADKVVILYTDGIPDEIRVRKGLDIWTWLYNEPLHDFDYFQDISRYANDVNEENSTSGQVDVGIEFFRFPSYYADWEDAATETLHSIFNHVDTAGKIVGYKAVEFPVLSPDAIVQHTPLRNQIVPMYFYHKVLRQCFSEFGYTLAGELLENVDFLKLVLPNSYSILKEEVLRVTNLFGTNPFTDIDLLYGQASTTIESKNHLPDIPVIDFLRDFMLKFNVYFKFQGTTVTITANSLSQPQRELNDLNPEVIMEQLKDRGVNVKYNFPDDDGSYTNIREFREEISVEVPEDVDGTDIGSLGTDDRYIQQNRNSIYAKGTPNVLKVSNLIAYNTGRAKQFVSDLVPVEMAEFDYDFTNEITDGGKYRAWLPWFKHVPTYYNLKVYSMTWVSDNGGFEDIFQEIDTGGTYELNEGTQEKKIGLYHGMQETLDTDLAGYAYPFMSSGNYAPGDTGTPDSDVKLSEWHLGWLGDEGLIDFFWREFINIFNNNRKVTFKIHLTWQKVRTHDWASSQVIRNVKYYVSAIKLKVPSFLRGTTAIFETWEL